MGFFRNVTESRIVVTKFGNTAFTPQEILDLNNIDLVRTVVEDDVILDSIILFYIEEENWTYAEGNYINPADMLRASDLVSGSLPSSEFEVVMQEASGIKIGDVIQLGFNDIDWEDDLQSIPSEAMNFTVTGFVQRASSTSWKRQMYFHEDFFTSELVYTEAYMGNYGGSTYISFTYENFQIEWLDYGSIIINESLEDGEVLVADVILEELIPAAIPDFDPLTDDLDVALLAGIEFNLIATTAFELDINPVEVTGIFSNTGDRFSFLTMNSNTRNLLSEEDKYQVAVMVLDAYDAEKVMDDIEALGFNTIYPVSVDNEITAIFAILTTISLGFTLGFLMIVIYFISYIVLKNVQNSKKKDYLIFRSIGASKRDLNRVTILELFITTIMAYVITMILLYINEFFDSYIPQYLRYFTVGNYLFVFFLLSVLALLLGNRFNKKLFGNTVITSLKQE